MRDAEMHLQNMKDLHSAIAPLMVGDEGQKVMDERRALLASALLGEDSQQTRKTAFDLMWSMANRKQS